MSVTRAELKKLRAAAERAAPAEPTPTRPAGELTARAHGAYRLAAWYLGGGQDGLACEELLRVNALVGELARRLVAHPDEESAADAVALDLDADAAHLARHFDTTYVRPITAAAVDEARARLRASGMYGTVADLHAAYDALCDRVEAAAPAYAARGVYVVQRPPECATLARVRLAGAAT